MIGVPLHLALESEFPTTSLIICVHLFHGHLRSVQRQLRLTIPCEWKVHEEREYVRRHDEEERGRRGMIAGGSRERERESERVAVKALRQESSPGPAACSVQVLTIVALSLPTDFSLCRNCHSKSERREERRESKQVAKASTSQVSRPRDVLVCDKVRVRDSPPSLLVPVPFRCYRVLAHVPETISCRPGHELPESRFLSLSPS